MKSIAYFFVSNQQWLLALVLWPLITALFNVALRKRTYIQWEEWALAKPVLAFIIEVIRATGLDPFSLAQAFQRYAARKAGVMPVDTIRVAELPPPLKTALLNPDLTEILSEAAVKVQDTKDIPKP